MSISNTESGLLLLPAECAKRLRLHEETFRRWLREGKVRTRLKVGRGWRIPVSELQRLEREALMPEK